MGFLDKEEVIDTQDVISLYTLEKVVKERVTLLNEEFLKFKNVYNCNSLINSINSGFLSNDLFTQEIKNICPFVDDEQVSFTFYGDYNIGSFVNHNLMLFSEGFCGNFEFKLIKDRNTDNYYFLFDDEDNVFVSMYEKYIKKYKDDIFYIAEVLEKGYDYFGNSVNDNSLNIFKNNSYKEEDFEIKTDKDLNFTLDVKDEFKDLYEDMTVYKDDIFKRIPISIADLDINIQKILEINNNYRVEYDLFSDINKLSELIDEKNENIYKIIDIYNDFDEKYYNKVKDMNVSRDVLKIYTTLKRRICDIRSNIYFGFMDIIDDNMEHYVDKNDVCKTDQDCNNLLCAIEQDKVMPHGNVVIDENGCVSRVSGNIVVKNKDDKQKIMIRKKI